MTRKCFVVFDCRFVVPIGQIGRFNCSQMLFLEKILV